MILYQSSVVLKKIEKLGKCVCRTVGAGYSGTSYLRKIGIGQAARNAMSHIQKVESGLKSVEHRLDSAIRAWTQQTVYAARRIVIDQKVVAWNFAI